MPYDSLQVGHIEILALLDGVQDLDEPMSSAFPDWPEGAHDEYRDRYSGVYAPDDRWRITVRCWLVRHAGGVLLVDTGIGRKGSSPSPAWLGVAEGALLDALRETGAAAESIDTVLITHVHDDHIGGASALAPHGKLVPAFPNARYVLQRADWEWVRESAKEDEEGAEIWSLLLAPLEQAGVVDLVEGDHRVADGIDVHPVPGHTPGHQVVRLESNGSRALISGDTWNHPAQLYHPDWPSGPDQHRDQAAASRRALLADVLSHAGTVVAPTHFAEAFGTVDGGKDGLASWTPRT